MALGALAPAVFLDKDGTLIDDVPYNVDPARIRLARGVAEGARHLHDAGFRLVMVSNQSGVAFGRFELDDLGAVTRRVHDLLAVHDVSLLGAYYCPHHPEGDITQFRTTCTCRKPRPGMLLRAAYEHGIDLGRSWMVGDILDDVEAGRRAGCRTVLVDNGSETEWQYSADRVPHVTVPDLAGAAEIICADAARTRMLAG